MEWVGFKPLAATPAMFTNTRPGALGRVCLKKPQVYAMQTDIEKEIAYRVRYLVAQGKSREEALEIANTELLTVELAPIASATANTKSKKAKYQRAAARARREIPNITIRYGAR